MPGPWLGAVDTEKDNTLKIITMDRHSGIRLESQHSGDKGRRTMSLRLALAIPQDPVMVIIIVTGLRQWLTSMRT